MHLNYGNKLFNVFVVGVSNYKIRNSNNMLISYSRLSYCRIV